MVAARGMPGHLAKCRRERARLVKAQAQADIRYGECVTPQQDLGDVVAILAQQGKSERRQLLSEVNL